MKRILLAVGLAAVLALPARAQVGSPKTPTTLNTETNTSFADNTTGAITPAITRQMLLDLIASGINVPSLGGDCTASSNILITCTKTGGVNFAPSATIDTTNASNITTGTLPAAQLSAGVPANVLRTVTTTDSVLNTDCGKTLNITGSNIVETLPSVSGFAANCVVTIKNANTTRGQRLSGFPANVVSKLYPLQSVQVSIVNGLWASTNIPSRWVITGTTNIFVDRTQGSDANDCLASAASACATVSQAMTDIASNLDNQGVINIQFGCNSTPCTYADLPLVAKNYVGSGSIFILGDTVTPSNFVWSCAASCPNGAVTNWLFGVGGFWVIEGFKFTSALSGANGIQVTYTSGATVEFGKVEFGAFTNGVAISCIGAAHINDLFNYTISGGGTNFAVANDGCVLHLDTAVGTITGTPAFSAFFIGAHGSGAVLGTTASNFSGAATGVRCSASLLGLVDTGGTSASLPGNSACTATTSGFVN